MIKAHAIEIEQVLLNKRLRPQRWGFLQNILQKPCFVTSSRFVISFIVLLQNKHTTLVENGENSIRAKPRFSAHTQGQKFGKRPGRLIE